MLQITIDTGRVLRLAVSGNNKTTQQLIFRGINIDGLIEYLQDVKVFLSEEDMVKELMGK